MSEAVRMVFRQRSRPLEIVPTGAQPVPQPLVGIRAVLLDLFPPGKTRTPPRSAYCLFAPTASASALSAPGLGATSAFSTTMTSPEASASPRLTAVA